MINNNNAVLEQMERVLKLKGYSKKTIRTTYTMLLHNHLLYQLDDMHRSHSYVNQCIGALGFLYVQLLYTISLNDSSTTKEAEEATGHT